MTTVRVAAGVDEFRIPGMRRLGSGRAEGGRDAVTWLTVYLVVLYAIPSRLVIAPLGSAGAPSMLLGLLSLAAWLALTVVGSSRRPFLELFPLKWALAAFLASVGVSYALAMMFPISSDEISPADVSCVVLASWAGTMLLAHDTIRSRRRLETMVWRFALAGTALALVGLAQFVTRQSLVDMISVPGLTAVSDTGLSFRNGLPRPAGTALHPIEFGALLAIVLPLALHVALYRVSLSPWLRWAPATAIAAMIALSSSRSAYLGGLIGVAICLVAWTPRVRRRFLAVAVVGIGAVAVLAPRVLNSIVGLFTGVSDDPSIASRTDSFAFALRFLMENPWFGRGTGTLLPGYRIFDNQYLGLLVVVGIVGTVLFVAIAFVAVRGLLTVFRVASDAPTADLAVSLAASIVVGFTTLAFFDAFAFPMTMGTLFLALGLGGALIKLTREESRSGLSIRSVDL